MKKRLVFSILLLLGLVASPALAGDPNSPPPIFINKGITVPNP